MALGILQHTKICVSTIVLLSFVSFISGGLPPCKCGRRACSFPGGGVWLEKDVRRSRGVKVQAEECGQGEGGGLKSRKFCGRPLWMVPLPISNLLKYVMNTTTMIPSPYVSYTYLAFLITWSITELHALQYSIAVLHAQGSYRDVLSDSHNHVQIVATAINSQILSFCNEKSRKREIATKSCGSEILATLRHVQSSISSLTPYSLFLHFTILLLIWQQLKEKIRGAEKGLWINV